MAIPDFAAAEVYKARTVQSQVRVAVELDYPVFSGSFDEQFAGGALDTDKWFSFVPSWGVVTVAGGTLLLSVSGDAISPPWVQSRHNLAFPLRRDTDWVMEARIRFPTITGFGVFFRICGRSFRDAEAIFAVKANEAEGLIANCPDGYAASSEVYNAGGADTGWKRYRLEYDASAQLYTWRVDSNDDGAWESSGTVAVAGRYADAIVIGNSTAIQGNLGAWTEIEVAYVTVTGTAEAVVDPEWAAPFSYDGSRFAYLPTVLGGRISVDKENSVDACDVELDNFGMQADGRDYRGLYTSTRFLGRRAFVEGRAGDGNGKWAPWELLFQGLCGEKQARLQEGGQCSVSLPMRDRRRAQADDVEVLACYSDAADAIDGVGMNMTVAQIVEDILQNEAGLLAAAMNVVATPDDTPRNYNVFRQSALAAVKTLCEQTALALWQRRSDARIEVQEWSWGSDAPTYQLSTAEEVWFVEWTESAFDVTSAEQLTFENTQITGFTHTWPPHREPFYGRLVHANAVTVQDSTSHDARPVTALTWWVRNRKLGSVTVTMPAAFWLEHDLELALRDDRFLGIDPAEYESWIVDGWEHTWQGREVVQTQARLIYPHPDRFLRRGLP